MPPEGSIKLAKPKVTGNVIEGGPLIFHDGLYGAFCYGKITATEAEVICRQLGYVTSTANDCCYSDSGSNEKVWVYNIKCTGIETDISQCDFTYGLDTEKCTSRAEVTCSSQ